ncbi:MAG TPA: Gfo/Idh/MocA family oxidoreductase, partial [bacterium]|nr:Gfo/Idh/MocA family oxidoreductase [bacterium]
MKKSSSLKFGIISSASVLAYGFMPAVKLTEGVEAVAIASRDLTKAKQTASRYGIPKAYGSYNEILRDPGVDCIYVPLPNAMHIEWARKALKAGKHVLCEKPAGWSAREVASLRGLIEKTGLIFAEAFQYRYHPLMTKIKEIIDKGTIGEVVNVEASYCEVITSRDMVQFKPDMAGGSLMDVGCYCVDFCRFIIGCDEAEVLKTKSKIVRGVDGDMKAELLFSNG